MPRISKELFTLRGGEPVLLQAMKEEPPLAAKCNDGFLIKSTTITPEKETLYLADIVSSNSFPLLANWHLNFLPCLPQPSCLRDTVEHQRW